MASTHRHTIYIRCRPSELWAALTEGQTTRQYYYDALVESSFEPGAPIRYVVESNPHDGNDVDGDATITASVGEIESIEPERSLVHSFRFADLDDPPTRIRWTLTENVGPGVVRVDVTHEGCAPETETWSRIDGAWPVILSGLKSWLETGVAIGIVGFGSTSPQGPDVFDNTEEPDDESHHETDHDSRRKG